MSRLFTYETPLTAGTPAPSVIRTPLGTVQLAAVIADEQLTGDNADEACSVGNEGRLWSRRRTWGVVELLLCRPTPTLPSHLTVDDCWAAMWRLQLASDVSGANFTCEWQPRYAWSQFDIENGKNLLSCAWDDGRTVVSLGTEDEFILKFRAEREDWLPQRLLPIMRPGADVNGQPLIDLSTEGIRVNFTELRVHERVQIQFVSAWRPLDADSVATWLAVNLDSDEILAGASCS